MSTFDTEKIDPAVCFLVVAAMVSLNSFIYQQYNKRRCSIFNFEHKIVRVIEYHQHDSPSEW
jgi:hypothetical protein